MEEYTVKQAIAALLKLAKDITVFVSSDERGSDLIPLRRISLVHEENDETKFVILYPRARTKIEAAKL